MAYWGYDKLWENEFDEIVSKKSKVQDINVNQLKLDIVDTYDKYEKIPTNFKPVDDEDVIN